MPKSMQQHSHEALNFIVPISCEYGIRDDEREKEGWYMCLCTFYKNEAFVSQDNIRALSHTHTRSHVPSSKKMYIFLGFLLYAY